MKVTITKLVNNIAIEHSVEGTHEEIVNMLVFLKLTEYANGGYLSTKINLESRNDKITAEDIRKAFRRI